MHKYIKTAYSSSDFKDLSRGIGQRGNASVALSLCDGKPHHPSPGAMHHLFAAARNPAYWVLWLVMARCLSKKPIKTSKKASYICNKCPNLKSIVSILFAILILLQSFSKVWIFISFKINQNYIEKILCINQDKTEVLCSGKCVLRQWVKAEEEKESKEMPQKLKDQKEAFYCLEIFKWQIEYTLNEAANQKKSFFHQTPCAAASVEGIFRPPKFVMV